MLDTPTRSLSAADTPDTLVFSATECTIEAGGSYELPVPTDPEGSFVLYEYHEDSKFGHAPLEELIAAARAAGGGQAGAGAGAGTGAQCS